MKNLRLFAFLLIISMVVSAISFKVLAETKTCPSIPTDVKEVEIKEKIALIRTSYQDKDNSNIAFKAKLGDRLKLKDNQGILQGKYCWYKLEPSSGSSEQELWVADLNLKKPFAVVSPSLSTSPSSTPTQENLTPSPSLLPWVWGLMGALIGTIISLLTAFIRLNQFKKALETQAQDIRLLQRNHQASVTKTDNQLNSLKIYLEEKYRKLAQKLQELQDLQNQQRILESKFNQPPIIVEPPTLPFSIATTSELIATKEIDLIIEKFNSQDKLYFDDSRFRPVKLTKESIQGSVGIDGRRTIRFEQAEPSQGTYLEFCVDSENWLIPNITSPYYNQIRNQLSANPEIFAINLGSGNNQLVKPAKLKSVSGGFWEIAEPGEFGFT